MPFRDYQAFTSIEELINAEGIPNTGISFLAEQPAGKNFPVISESYGTFYVDVNFTPAATPAQRARVAEIIATADKRPRPPKTQAEQIADLGKLKQADKDKILLALAADKLKDDPGFIERLGIPYKGDKDPTGQAQGK